VVVAADTTVRHADGHGGEAEVAFTAPVDGAGVAVTAVRVRVAAIFHHVAAVAADMVHAAIDVAGVAIVTDDVIVATARDGCRCVALLRVRIAGVVSARIVIVAVTIVCAASTQLILSADVVQST